MHIMYRFGGSTSKISQNCTAGVSAVDPFCGSGTVPATCKRLGQRWLAQQDDKGGSRSSGDIAAGRSSRSRRILLRAWRFTMIGGTLALNFNLLVIVNVASIVYHLFDVSSDAATTLLSGSTRRIDPGDPTSLFPQCPPITPTPCVDAAIERPGRSVPYRCRNARLMRS